MFYKIKNAGIEKNIFNEYKDHILNVVKDIYDDCNFKFKCVVKTSNLDTDSSGICGRKGQKYEIVLYKKAFSRNLDYLDLVIYHELIHAKDASIINLKDSTFKTHKIKFRSYKDFITNIGYRSWTEFNACLNVNAISNSYKMECTFLEMVKSYEKLLKMKEAIQTSEEDLGEINKLLIEYVNEIDSFVYFSSRFIAADLFRNSKNKHCEKTKNKEAYVCLSNLYSELRELYRKSYHGKYGKHMMKRMYKLGLFWMENLYVTLNLYLCKNRRYVTFVFSK